jgi:hypothetical protein
MIKTDYNAFEQGTLLRKAIQEKSEFLDATIKKLLDASKKDNYDFIHLYLELCVCYGFTPLQNSLKTFGGDDITKFKLSFITGLMTDDTKSEYISIKDAVEIFDIKNDSTIRKAISDKRIKESDALKDGHQWKIKVSALDKLYKRKEVLK